MTGLQDLPSVEELLQTRESKALVVAFGRPLTLRAIREVLRQVRSDFLDGRKMKLPGKDQILEKVGITLDLTTRPSLHPAINATGVILHTNLGRAPLSQAAINAMQAIAGSYSNLEFDLATGKRGSRLVHAEDMLKTLLGCEAALVVNNNASAVLLALSALAPRKRVIIPRSQLVEIGGGFRVPDVMKQSGARLVEIGTTNRTHLEDYRQALQEPAALVMRAHRSNFKMIGFTGEPEQAEVASLAREAGLPLVDDLGSGALIDTARFGLAHEPTVQESLAAGASLVCFSGDKLLGGPQAGIIVGDRSLIDQLKKHPLARAVRADKLCLAALAATLLHYLKDEAEQEVPILRMLAAKPPQLNQRVKQWAGELGSGKPVKGLSTVGGGSLPGETLPTWLLAVQPSNVDQVQGRLRSNEPAIIARVEKDSLLFDPRTVLPQQDETLLAGLQKALSSF